MYLSQNSPSLLAYIPSPNTTQIKKQRLEKPSASPNMRVFEKPRLATHKRGTTPPIKQSSSGSVSLTADFTNTLFQLIPICKTSGSPLSTGLSKNFPQQPHWPPPLTTRLHNQLMSTKPFSK